jgi:hypothetical protein
MTHIFQPKAKWRHQGKAPGALLCEWYTWGDCNVFVGRESDRGVLNWHLSISTPYRNPTWEEIKQARYDLCPHDVTMAMILPPTDQFINIHNFCFHLWQIPNE